MSEQNFDINKCEPLHGFVMVELHEPKEEKSKGGLFLPTTDKAEKIKVGTVVAIGREVPEDIELGGEVYFSNFGGSDMPTSVGNYRQIRYTELYGKILK